jgi:alpha-beta hydrolase superfamily lysophospholipase
MGGTIAVSYTLAHQRKLAGLILSGPLAAMPPSAASTRIIAKALSTIAPKAPAIAVDATLVSRDPAVVKAYVEDPLVHHGKLPVRTVAELGDAISTFPDRVSTIAIPTLIVYGTDDALCPPEGSKMLGERIGATDKTVNAYEGLHHEVLNEPERDKVLDDMCSWLGAKVAAVTV